MEWRLKALERQQERKYSLTNTSRDPMFLTIKPQFHIYLSGRFLNSDWLKQKRHHRSKLKTSPNPHRSTQSIISFLQILLNKLADVCRKANLGNLFSFHEEMPEVVLDETNVDRYKYHNNFDISQSQYRIVRVSKGFNKKFLASNFFQFCKLKTQCRCLFQEQLNNSKRELTALVDSLRVFVKTFDHAGMCIQILLPQPKV